MFGFPSWSVLLVVGLVSAAGASWGTHQVDLATINGLKASYAEAETAAVTKAKKLQADADAVTLAAALEEAARQVKIVTNTVTLTKLVTRYVKDVPDCPDAGFVSLYNHAVSGDAPGEVSSPAGQSDGGGSAPETPHGG